MNRPLKKASFYSRILLFWIAFLGLSGLAMAEGTVLKTQTGTDQAQVILEFPSKVTASRRDTAPDVRGQSNVVLALNQPLSELDLDKAGQAVDAWVESLWGGFDSLLVRPRAGVILHSETRGNRLTLTLTRKQAQTKAQKQSNPSAPKAIAANPPSIPVAAPSVRQQRRLERLEALWLFRNDQPQRAAAKLRALIDRYPDAVQARIDLAQVEQSMGRWQKALHLYQTVLDLKPDNRAVVAAKVALLKEHSSFVELRSHDESFGDTEEEQNLTLKARLRLDEWFALEVEQETLDLNEKVAITRANGESGLFQGQRNDLTLRLLYHRDAHGWGQLALSSNGKETGLFLRHHLLRDNGLYWLEAGLNETWNELPVAAIDYGTRDRLGVGYRTDWKYRLYFNTDSAINRYHLNGRNDVAKSWEWNLGLRYRFPAIAPNLDVGYALDKERPFAQQDHMDANGNPYKPLGLIHSEVHSLDLQWSDRLVDYLQANARVGYGKDRYNGKGPFLNLGLTYEPLPELEAGLFYDIDNTSGRAGNNTLTRLGAYLKVRF